MSVGAAAVTATPTYDTKKLVFSGSTVWFRNLVTLTLASPPVSVANCVFLVYRGSTLVALAQTPTVAVFSLDTNTAEMEDFFPDTLSIGEIREFQVYLYNADPTSLEMLGSGVLEVRAIRDYSATAPIPPLSSTTVFIGSFAFYNGKTYLRSVTDNLYYEFAAYGAGSAASDALSTTGITIPGSP
jgi:hypothetical protein